MSKVDAHHHVWDLTVREQTWMVGPELDPIRRNYSIEDLAPSAAAADVTSTVVVQTVSQLDETVELLEVAAGNDLVAGVVGWVDLTAPDIADTLGALRERPDGAYLKGIRHQVHDEPDVDWLLRDDVQRGLAAVAEAGLVYDLLTKTPHLPAAIQTVRAFPQLTFVVDHISKPVIGDPLDPWATQLRELAALPNVTCKLSGMVTEAPWSTWKPADLQPYADTVLETFGPPRVMFGSDWPVCLLAATYPQVHELTETLTTHLTPTEQTQIFTTTATTTYNL
ncbi:amidohydrolase family protein [Kribbella sp. NPDC055071]